MGGSTRGNPVPRSVSGKAFQAFGAAGSPGDGGSCRDRRRGERRGAAESVAAEVGPEAPAETGPRRRGSKDVGGGIAPAEGGIAPGAGLGGKGRGRAGAPTWIDSKPNILAS